MFLDVYVGRLDDPDFVARKDKPGGASPRRHSEFFPNGRSAFYEVIRRIEKKICPGAATEHITYVSPASREVIMEFFEEMHRKDLSLRSEPVSPHLLAEAETLRAWINAMKDDGKWCLVASEL